MNTVFKISEAASLGLHAVTLMAEHPKRIYSVKEISETLNASEAHLSKVLQRLVKAGLLTSTRGPRGGFMLTASPDDVTLLDIYEGIEGELKTTECLFDTPICNGNACIFGDLIRKMNREVREYLSSTNISRIKI
jgi:Rrf2 family protein